MSEPRERLRAARKRARMSVAELAARVGFSQPTIRAHENGQNRIQVGPAEKYASVLGISTAWLLLGDSDERPDQALPVKPGKIRCEDCLWWGRERAHDRDYPAGSCRGGLPRSVETFPLTYINPDGARFNTARGRWPWTMFDDWCSHAVWKGEAK